MTCVHTLASGSSGNALLFQWDGGCLLLDAGISCRRITNSMKELSLSPADLSAILITHTHADHVGGLQTLLKRTQCPVLASPRACRELDYRFPGLDGRLDALPPCKAVDLNGCEITAFPTSHDSPGSAGFRLDTPEGGFGFLTDTGFVTDEAKEILPGVRFLLLEANHDVETLLSGPYPVSLKQRILGPWGHLSNEDAAAFAVDMAAAGAEEIVLAHLSRENNTPAMALRAVSTALGAAGFSPSITVAPRDTMGPACRAERRVCGKPA